MNNVHVEFELPSFSISQSGIDLNNVNDEVKKILALFLYEHQRISLGKACEIGGFSLWELSELNRQFGISIDYSEQDLDDDLLRLSDV